MSTIYKSEAGESDMLLKAEKSIERIRLFAPNVTSVLLPGVGHAVINQAPRILGFLASDKRNIVQISENI